MHLTAHTRAPHRNCQPRAITQARRYQLAVRAESNQQGSPSSTTSSPPEVSPNASTSAPSNSGNAGLAIGAVGAAVLLFAATRFGGDAPTINTLEQLSVPLEVALSNGKPTVMEFYASWCEVCRELVPEEYAVEQKYRGSVNFVMLNVENTKWAPEVAEYGVNGIPHFVFLDKAGQPLTAAVGRLPREILEGNVVALAEDKPLPFSRARGRTSSMTPPQGAMAGPKQAAPRDHA